MSTTTALPKVIALRHDTVLIDKSYPVLPTYKDPVGGVQFIKASFGDEGVFYPATDIYISVNAKEAQELSAFFSDLSRRLSKAQP